MPVKKRESAPNQVFELEIVLLEIEPKIWRRFAVRSNHSLMVLHDIIQMVMGWKDCHLHEFAIGDQVYTARYPELDDFDERKTRDEKRSYLREVLGGEGSRFVYRYDFGDGWRHNLKVLKVSQPEEGVRYPVCLSGERSCPPEDVGGPWGYTEMLEALADPKHEEHDSYIEWLGKKFEPDVFDLKAVNRMLRNIR